MKHETLYIRNINELDAAQNYLYAHDPIIVFGRSKHDAQLLNRIKMPALPLLMSNRRERAKLCTPNVFKRCFGFATFKCRALIKVITRAIKQEKQKQMIIWQFNLQMQLQDPLPHEPVEQNPMTHEQFMQLCSNS
jgi:hypothetical protein